MSAIFGKLSAAVEHHKAGRREEAEALYRSVLRENPNHADTLHLLGVLAAECGNFDLAVAAIGRAIEVRPGVPVYYNNLGLAFSRKEDWERAAAAYRQALRMQPTSAALCSRLGEALGNLGRYKEAAEAYRRSVELDPDRGEVRFALGQALQMIDRLEEAEGHCRAATALDGPAEAWYQLGNVLHQLGRYEESIEPYQRAIEVEPDRAEAHYNLAGSLGKLGRHEEAVASLREALWMRPEYAEAHNNLGTAYQALGRLPDAEIAYRNAVQLNPGFVDALYNLAFAVQEQDRFDEALRYYNEVLRLKPDHEEARNNRGNICLLGGRFDEAIAGYDALLAARPEHAEANWNRALLRLQTGDWERGWKEYEWRFRQKEFTPKQFDRPRWAGEAVAGKAILVHAEQGLGDTIQFVRFLEPLKRLGCRVIFETQPRLKPLLAMGVKGVDELIARGEPRPPFDCHIELMSLPYRLGITLSTLPAEMPYLGVDSGLVARWRERMGGAGKRRIGLIWSGNPDYKKNRWRSLALRDLAPLAEVDGGVALYSLQRGAAAAEIDSAGFAIDNLELESNQPADTAAIMMNLDLIITVDTMTAHLAGALARPVWVLLDMRADWRWMTGRDDTPWYPTMRLFRQRARGDWAAVVARVRTRLS